MKPHEMKEEYKDFVGIYDESVPVELCNDFARNYEVAKKNRTIIDISKENKTQVLETPPQLYRKDEVAYITPLSSTIYPIPPVQAWPAGYTHMHRGNPPLDGEKMYVDGWFTGEKANNDVADK